MIILSMSLFPAIAINMPMVYLGNRYYQLKNKKHHTVNTKTNKKSEIKRQPRVKVISTVINESNLSKQKRISSVKYFAP